MKATVSISAGPARRVHDVGAEPVARTRCRPTFRFVCPVRKTRRICLEDGARFDDGRCWRRHSTSFAPGSDRRTCVPHSGAGISGRRCAGWTSVGSVTVGSKRPAVHWPARASCETAFRAGRQTLGTSPTCQVSALPRHVRMITCLVSPYPPRDHAAVVCSGWVPGDVSGIGAYPQARHARLCAKQWVAGTAVQSAIRGGCEEHRITNQRSSKRGVMLSAMAPTSAARRCDGSDTRCTGGRRKISRPSDSLARPIPSK